MRRRETGGFGSKKRRFPGMPRAGLEDLLGGGRARICQRSHHVHTWNCASRCDCRIRRVHSPSNGRERRAPGQSRLGVGAIRVDVAPLRASAGDPTATWVEQELPRQLAQALAGRTTPGGGTLVVRIDSLTLGPIKDSRAWDNISGVAMVGGIARPVRATSRYWPSASDAAMIAQSNHARVSGAVQALAFWIARDLGA